MSTKVGVVSLGCDKNRVDTEVMLANLVAGGYEIVSDPSQADVIIVNTCAFLESARKEAIETVLEMARYKSANCKKVIVTGCLKQTLLSEHMSTQIFVISLRKRWADPASFTKIVTTG